jgi:hypothetical protein
LKNREDDPGVDNPGEDEVQRRVGGEGNENGSSEIPEGISLHSLPIELLQES